MFTSAKKILVIIAVSFWVGFIAANYINGLYGGVKAVQADQMPSNTAQADKNQMPSKKESSLPKTKTDTNVKKVKVTRLKKDTLQKGSAAPNANETPDVLKADSTTASTPISQKEHPETNKDDKTEAAKVKKISIQRGRTLTVAAPCEVIPVFDPDTVAVEGKGKVVAIYPIDSTTVSLVCKDGVSGYVVDISVQDMPSPEQTYFLEIKDDEYVSRKQKNIAAANISNYNKEQLLSEARGVLVAMINSAEMSGYEIAEKPTSTVQGDRDLSAKLIKTYAGNLTGYIYEITNNSRLKVRKNVKDFSTKGVIFVYSPSLSDTGDIMLPPLGKAVVYIVKTDTVNDTSASTVPWVGSDSSMSNLAATTPWVGDGSLPTQQAAPQMSAVLPPHPPAEQATKPPAAGGQTTQQPVNYQSQMQYPIQETLQAIDAIDMNQVLPILRK